MHITKRVENLLPGIHPELREYFEGLMTFKTGKIPTSTTHLKLLHEGIVIPACEGTRTMNTVGKLFPGNIDGDFENFGLNKPQGATPDTLVNVYEITRDSVGAMFFASLNVGMRHLVLTRDQIITYVEKHPELLHPTGNSTLFLTEENGNLYCAGVFCDVSDRKVGVRSIDDDGVWGAENTNRVVVPRLVPVAG